MVDDRAVGELALPNGLCFSRAAAGVERPWRVSPVLGRRRWGHRWSGVGGGAGASWRGRAVASAVDGRRARLGTLGRGAGGMSGAPGVMAAQRPGRTVATERV